MNQIITKKHILSLIFIISYVVIIYRSVWGGYDAISIVGSTLPYHLINLFLVNLLVIERQDIIHHKYFYRIVGSITIIISIIGFLDNMWIGIGLSVRHIGYIIYMRTSYLSISNYRIISLWTIATSGLSLISMFLSIGYAMIFLSYSRPLEFDCQNLSHQTIGLLTTYLPTHIDMTTGSIYTITHNIETFKNKTLGQIVGVSTAQTLSESDATNTGTLLGIVETYKKNLVDDFISNKQIIDQGVCDFTLGHIKTITQNSTFKISAIILLVLLLSVFMGGLLIASGCIYFLILLILYRYKVYNIHKEKGSHEIIK